MPPIPADRSDAFEDGWFEETVSFIASERALGRPVDFEAIRRRRPAVAEDEGVREQVESVLAIPEWFSEPSVERLPADVPRRAHRITKWGDYLLLEEIGRGGMGQVFKAWDMQARRFVALKRLRSDRMDDDGACRRFREEPRHVRKLDHEAIVPVLDVGEIEGRPYFTMEWIQGAGLVHLARHQMLPEDRIAGLILKIAESVAVAHEAGVLHRDLKPANVLLTTELAPKLVDFGLAKDVGAKSDLTGSLVLGTLNYMSPEQAAGSPVDERTDVYGLGAILYELLTARPPFRGATVTELLYRVRHLEPQPPRQVSAGVDAGLEAICLKCLEKNPSRRYQSAAEVADECSRILSGRRQLAPFHSWPRRLIRRARRHPAATAAIALLVTTVMSVIGLGVWVGYERQRAELSRIKRDRESDLRRLAELERNAAQRQERLARALGFRSDGDRLRQQGRWQDAQAAYQLAIDEGHPETFGLRLRIAKCRLQLGDVDGAVADLTALLDERRLPESHRASALLWRGNALLGRADDRARSDLKAAEGMKQELPPADQKFLAGLVTDRLSTAVGSFREAVELESEHLEARRMLAATLLFSGRLAECKEQTRICQAFAPDDVPITLLGAVVRTLLGERDEAAAMLKAAEGTPFEPVLPQFRKALGLIEEFNDLDRRNAITYAEAVYRFAPFLMSAAGMQSSDSWLRVPVPPQIYAAYRPLFQRMAGAMLIGNRRSVVHSLSEITDDVQEGSLLYVLGRLQIQQGDWRAARESFQASKTAPKLINVDPDIDYYLARICWELSRGAEPEKANQLQQAAIDHVRQFVRQEQLPVIPRQDLTQLAEMAFVREETWTAIEVALSWKRRYPDDAEPYLVMGIAFLKNRQYDAARSQFELYQANGGTNTKAAVYMEHCNEALDWFAELQP